MIFERLVTYGDYINVLIREKIFRLKKCKECGYENYLRFDDRFYCNKCGQLNEEDFGEEE